MAQGYYRQDMELKTFQLNVSAVFAGGGTCSTASDLVLWMDALKSGKVVQPESYQRMINPIQVPNSSNYTSGYGLFIMQDQYGLQVVTTSGEVGSVSFQISYPEKGLTVVLLTNTMESIGPAFDMISSMTPYLMR